MNKFRLSPHALALALLLLLTTVVAAQIVSRPDRHPSHNFPGDPRERENRSPPPLAEPNTRGGESRSVRAGSVEQFRVKILLDVGNKALKQSPPNYARAGAAYRNASEINPREVRAYEGLGEVYAAQGLYEKAVQAYEEVVRIKPKRAEAHFTLGALYSRLGRKEEAWGEVVTLRKLKNKVLADKLEALIGGS